MKHHAGDYDSAVRHGGVFSDAIVFPMDSCSWRCGPLIFYWRQMSEDVYLYWYGCGLFKARIDDGAKEYSFRNRKTVSILENCLISFFNLLPNRGRFNSVCTSLQCFITVYFETSWTSNSSGVLKEGNF